MLRLQAIRDARQSLVGKALVTPLLPAHGLATPGGNPIWLKTENLQPSGSFKIRGACHSLARLTAAQRAAGVIAYSTGNHARAVALAARQQGIAAELENDAWQSLRTGQRVALPQGPAVAIASGGNTTLADLARLQG